MQNYITFFILPVHMDIIQVFEKIRDLPFHCPESLEDKDYRCWGKTRILYAELRKMGFEVRFRVCEFKWAEQRIPKEITSKSPDEIGQHLFLEIKLSDNWIVLDCTNDSKLPKFNKWDGKSNCEIAVKYAKMHTPEESQRLEQIEHEEFKENFEKYKEFYIKTNEFFEKLRKRLG